MSLRFDPPFLPMQTGLAAVVAVSLVVGLYFLRELRDRAVHAVPLVALRSVLVLALAFILLNPVVVTAHRLPSGRSPFVILLDTSRSMRMPDGDSGRTRYDDATRRTIGNPALMSELARRYDVRLFQFADKPAAAGPEALL